MGFWPVERPTPGVGTGNIRSRSVLAPTDPSWIQVLRGQDRPRVHPRRGRRGGPKRVGQVQRGGRDLVGARRAGPAEPPRRPDDGCHLRREPQPAAARDGRGQARHRQLGRSDPGPGRRDRDQPHHLPLGRERVPPGRPALPAAGHPGGALGCRHRPCAARDRRPGAPGRDPPGPPRGPPAVHRGGRGHRQAPAPPRAQRAEARRHRAGRAAARATSWASCAAS